MRSLLATTFTGMVLIAPALATAQISTPPIPEGTGALPISGPSPPLGVPVGTILPYLGPLDALSAEWLPCDGRTVTDTRSPLHGVQLPDLTDDRFLMGVKDEEQVGLAGGTNAITQDGIHGHTGSTSARVRQQEGTPRYLITRGNRGFQHTHEISIGRTGGHSHGGENRPNFYGVRFIIRVK